jgi:hypothetical protein
MTTEKFLEDVSAVLNTVMPRAEARATAAGHPLRATERAEVARLVRESLSGNHESLEALKIWTGTPVAESAKGPGDEKGVKEELVRACRVARLMLGRGPTAAEQADLETTIRARAVPTLTETGPLAFAHAVMEGRLGAARSPGFAPPVVRTVKEITESAGNFSPETSKLSDQLPAFKRDEIFDQAMVDFARTVPFGARRLDG